MIIDLKFTVKKKLDVVNSGYHLLFHHQFSCIFLTPPTITVPILISVFSSFCPTTPKSLQNHRFPRKVSSPRECTMVWHRRRCLQSRPNVCTRSTILGLKEQSPLHFWKIKARTRKHVVLHKSLLLAPPRACSSLWTTRNFKPPTFCRACADTC